VKHSLEVKDLELMKDAEKRVSTQIKSLSESKSEVRKRIDTVKMMLFSSELMRNLMMDLLDLA